MLLLFALYLRHCISYQRMRIKIKIFRIPNICTYLMFHFLSLSSLSFQWNSAQLLYKRNMLYDDESQIGLVNNTTQWDFKIDCFSMHIFLNVNLPNDKWNGKENWKSSPVSIFFVGCSHPHSQSHTHTHIYIDKHHRTNNRTMINKNHVQNDKKLLARFTSNNKLMRTEKKNQNQQQNCSNSTNIQHLRQHRTMPINYIHALCVNKTYIAHGTSEE